MDNQKTLYIGAHADDVVINAAITIRRNIGTAYILTITDGVPYGTYPKVFKGIILNSREAYIRATKDGHTPTSTPIRRMVPTPATSGLPSIR